MLIEWKEEETEEINKPDFVLTVLRGLQQCRALDRIFNDERLNIEQEHLYSIVV